MKQSDILKKCLIGILLLLAVAAFMASPDPALPTAEWSLRFWEGKAGCALCVWLAYEVNMRWAEQD